MEKWYKLEHIPDLTLNKYSSLEDKGVDGVIKKHIAFLRQINRKGIVSNVSFHLFYLYVGPDFAREDVPGHRLHILLMIKGDSVGMENVDALIKASPLSAFFPLTGMGAPGGERCSQEVLDDYVNNISDKLLCFTHCATLTKAEKHISNGDEKYFLLHEWESNEDGRLYNMCKMMEALNKTCLYRIDLYPVELSGEIRESLKKPLSILRKRQDERGIEYKRDYEGRDVIREYEDLIDKYEEEPHFIMNTFVFGHNADDVFSVLDSVGAESLCKGKYEIADFKLGSNQKNDCLCFLDDYPNRYICDNKGIIMRKGKLGSVVCEVETAPININYLPTLFSLDEVAPFFRFPALYDGESIQIEKETDPIQYGEEKAILLGKDRHGYNVNFPLKLFVKHAFISGVPGSGKTNAMHHITSQLWRNNIPFLVLEPAKQEYRALLNTPEMKEVHLFSPNADMSFPLHINPFEMPKGTIIAEHIRKLEMVFEGAFPLEPPMPFFLDTAIEEVYRELGWKPEDIYMGEAREKGEKKRSLPTMSLLYKKLENELEKTSYSGEVRGNLESAIKARIGGLLRRELGDIFDVPKSTIPPEKWLEIPAIIELEALGTGPANFLTLMMCSLIREALKAEPNYSGEIRHVLFIEEAHNLIGPVAQEETGEDADPKKAATAFLVKMLAEVRALKEGIVIADQLPTVMAQEVLKNTGLKLGLRITSSDDRSELGNTMSASPLQLEEMATFNVGESLVFFEGLKKPFKIQISEWCGEIQDKDKKDQFKTPKSDEDLRLFLQNNSSFNDNNVQSIEIIGAKYVQLRNEYQSKIDDCYFWCDQILALRNAISENKKTFLDCEKGIKTISNSEYDSLLKRDIEQKETLTNLENDKERIIDIGNTITQIGDWVMAIEILKSSRWKRFEIPTDVIHRILALENRFITDAKELFEKLQKTVPSQKLVIITHVAEMIDELVQVQKEILNEEREIQQNSRGDNNERF